MEETPPKEAAASVVKKSGSKPSAAATPEKSTALKRGNGADRDPKDLKRAKNKNEKGYEPSKVMSVFFDFIKSLLFDVSTTQLKDKISRSRMKFENHVKGKKKRKQEALKTELSMDAGEERMEVEMERDSSVKKVLKFDRNASVGTMDDYVVRSGLDSGHGMKKEGMEEKWRKLHIAELELFLKRNELIREQAKLKLERQH
ncbi:hypothetical protein SADUNF_Sadunf09G0071200 [Salix dunnii]|uniref:Glabrous enhancer-binding protein-like DBD domain-containing protein n=1 Tax=Salix dunnii TaxID=1413687 RepID=A0A835MZZ3_9ROSI|nr:hypothetical protein SADUNF_Sadunf09G0071200 [Salix dunnii]